MFQKQIFKGWEALWGKKGGTNHFYTYNESAFLTQVSIFIIVTLLDNCYKIFPSSVDFSSVF